MPREKWSATLTVQHIPPKEVLSKYLCDRTLVCATSTPDCELRGIDKMCLSTEQCSGDVRRATKILFFFQPKQYRNMVNRLTFLLFSFTIFISLIAEVSLDVGFLAPPPFF